MQVTQFVIRTHQSYNIIVYNNWEHIGDQENFQPLFQPPAINDPYYSHYSVNFYNMYVMFNWNDSEISTQK